MRRLITRNLIVGSALALAASGQTYQRQASIVGGGGDRGKCTVEVVVDGVAQIQIRGAAATIRNMSGQPAQWRRFECTSPLPPNPVNFRFQGIDGRGRQTLVGDPRNGGVAVVEIEDKDNGSEGYTFDITWDGNGQYNRTPAANGQYDRVPDRGPGSVIRDQPGPPIVRDRNNDSDRYRADNRYGNDEDRYRPGYRDSDYYHRYNHGFSVDEAVRVCQDSVMRQASTRFRATDIHIERTALDSNSGRQDWITGQLDVHRGGRRDLYNFACSVDFNGGRIRTVELDSRPADMDRR